MQAFKKLGLTGLAIFLTVNLVALLSLHAQSAVFFTAKWWIVWSTQYVLWFSFILIGITNPRQRA
jgi:hypothetical protein